MRGSIVTTAARVTSRSSSPDIARQKCDAYRQSAACLGVLRFRVWAGSRRRCRPGDGGGLDGAGLLRQADARHEIVEPRAFASVRLEVRVLLPSELMEYSP